MARHMEELEQSGVCWFAAIAVESDRQIAAI
jgi:hypothetical protein